MTDTLALVQDESRDTGEQAPPSLRVALVGNPNSGKSTLFNALTGLRQRVANFPGVTVERVEGSYRRDGTTVEVIDLPGMYSLSAESPDETIALDVVLGRADGVPAADVLVVVVDGERMERNLFLTTQVLELRRPTVIALTRMDRLDAAGVDVDVVELIHALGTVVVPVVATRGEGIDRLRHAIDVAAELPRASLHLVSDEAAGADAEPDVHDAGRRYRWIASVVSRVVRRRPPVARTPGDRVDAIVMHRAAGPVIFLAVMALMFEAMFSLGRPLADAVQALITLTGRGIAASMPPGELRGLLVDGVVNGVGSVVVFVPQIAMLFLFIGILEDTGYMARAAFVMDHWMRPLGLRGKSFIPLVSGFACAVPAVMGARTVQEPKERLATILVLPLMSCSARLPIFTLLVGAFVPPLSVAGASLQGLTLLAMYLLGTVAALATAALLRRTLLRAATRALIMELPTWSLPSARVLAASVWRRVRVFLREAGTIIFACAVVVWALATHPRPDPAPGTTVTQEQALSTSALGRIGHVIEPAVRPLGFDWKIAVSIVASFTAREVFVSTMGTLYGVERGADNETNSLAERLRAERNPSTGAPVYTTRVALALMAFYVFALMCTSTLAITMREIGGGWRGMRWVTLQFTWMLALAWVGAFLVYRGGAFFGTGGA